MSSRPPRSVSAVGKFNLEERRACGSLARTNRRINEVFVRDGYKSLSKDLSANNSQRGNPASLISRIVRARPINVDKTLLVVGTAGARTEKERLARVEEAVAGLGFDAAALLEHIRSPLPGKNPSFYSSLAVESIPPVQLGLSALPPDSPAEQRGRGNGVFQAGKPRTKALTMNAALKSKNIVCKAGAAVVRERVNQDGSHLDGVNGANSDSVFSEPSNKKRRREEHNSLGRDKRSKKLKLRAASSLSSTRSGSDPSAPSEKNMRLSSSSSNVVEVPLFTLLSSTPSAPAVESCSGASFKQPKKYIRWDDIITKRYNYKARSNARRFDAGAQPEYDGDELDEEFLRTIGSWSNGGAIPEDREDIEKVINRIGESGSVTNSKCAGSSRDSSLAVLPKPCAQSLRTSSAGNFIMNLAELEAVMDVLENGAHMVQLERDGGGAWKERLLTAAASAEVSRCCDPASFVWRPRPRPASAQTLCVGDPWRSANAVVATNSAATASARSRSDSPKRAAHSAARSEVGDVTDGRSGDCGVYPSAVPALDELFCDVCWSWGCEVDSPTSETSLATGAAGTTAAAAALADGPENSRSFNRRVLECEGCGVRVHPQCYGLPASRVDGVVRARAGIRRKRLDSFGPMVGTPAQRSGGGVMRASLSSTPSAFSPWHCALCVASASQSISQRRGDLPSSDGFDGSLPPMCLLCPRRGGAMKPARIIGGSGSIRRGPKACAFKRCGKASAGGSPGRRGVSGTGQAEGEGGGEGWVHVSCAVLLSAASASVWHRSDGFSAAEVDSGSSATGVADGSGSAGGRGDVGVGGGHAVWFDGDPVHRERVCIAAWALPTVTKAAAPVPMSVGRKAAATADASVGRSASLNRDHFLRSVHKPSAKPVALALGTDVRASSSVESPRDPQSAARHFSSRASPVATAAVVKYRDVSDSVSCSSGISGVSDGNCYLCLRSTGLLITCHRRRSGSTPRGGCCLAFHASCALFAGLTVQQRRRKRFGSGADSDSTNANVSGSIGGRLGWPTADVLAFCRRHTPPAERAMPALRSMTPAAPPTAGAVRHRSAWTAVPSRRLSFPASLTTAIASAVSVSTIIAAGTAWVPSASTVAAGSSEFGVGGGGRGSVSRFVGAHEDAKELLYPPEADGASLLTRSDGEKLVRAYLRRLLGANICSSDDDGDKETASSGGEGKYVSDQKRINGSSSWDEERGKCYGNSSRAGGGRSYNMRLSTSSRSRSVGGAFGVKCADKESVAKTSLRVRVRDMAGGPTFMRCAQPRRDDEFAHADSMAAKRKHRVVGNTSGVSSALFEQSVVTALYIWWLRRRREAGGCLFPRVVEGSL